MQKPWIFSSTFLPYTGEPIDFLLEDRSEPIHGTFADGQFHSRWADYRADRVQSWRESDARPFVLVEAPSVASGRSLITLMKRLARTLSGLGDAAPALSHCRVRTTATNAVANRSAVAVARRFDSNQISS